MLSVTIWRRTLDPVILAAARLASDVIGGGAPTTVEQALDKGRDTVYDVFVVQLPGASFVLKRCPDEREADVYRAWFTGGGLPVPTLRAHVVSDDVNWLALEHLEGTQPRDPSTHGRAGEALAAVHAEFWGARPGVGLASRWEEDASAIGDESVSAVARELAARASEVPGTLGHGDFEPANVVMSRTRAGIVDWTQAAPRPYFLDLARYGYLRGDDRQPQLNLQDRAAFLSSYRASLASLVPDEERFGRDVLLGQAALFMQQVAAGDDNARQDLFRVVHELS